MESFIKAGHIEPSVIIFDVFGTLVKIGERRSPYRKLGGVSKSMLKKSRLDFDKIEKCE